MTSIRPDYTFQNRKIALAIKSQRSKVASMKEKEPTKSVRIPEHIHRLAKVEAANSGKTISEVMSAPLEPLAKRTRFVPAKKGK
jgi:predicted HicB family RNase H-like nuclease